MANGTHQMEYLIKEAVERVASEGRNADSVDVMLAGFDYIAYQVNRPQWYAMKRVAPAAFGTGAAFGGGLLTAIFKFLGA